MPHFGRHIQPHYVSHQNYFNSWVYFVHTLQLFPRENKKENENVSVSNLKYPASANLLMTFDNNILFHMENDYAYYDLLSISGIWPWSNSQDHSEGV